MLIDPKANTNPRGSASTSVEINSRHVRPKPSSSCKVTSQKSILLVLCFLVALGQIVLLGDGGKGAVLFKLIDDLVYLFHHV